MDLWGAFISKRLGVKYCFNWAVLSGRGGFAWRAWGSVAMRRKAIWSFRLRLHSGLRQQGRAFGPVGLSWGFAPGWYRAGLRPSLLALEICGSLFWRWRLVVPSLEVGGGLGFWWVLGDSCEVGDWG